ncbi:MAG: gamma-glutamyl kinase [Rhodobacteraceae bacterium]|nr:gamma-glutamyl kinase [Paracoccaceae bacterium]
MLYFQKQNLVLFATPKTASTSLEAALAPHADIVLQGDPRIKHCTFHRYRWRFEKFLRIFVDTPPETVAMIREPEDWLSSWFRFRHGSWLDGTARSTRGLSFDDFVAGYIQQPKPEFAAVGSQSAFLTHPNIADDQVQTLWRYDAMPAFTQWLQDRLGVVLDLPQMNVSPSFDTPLGDDLRVRLQAHCARDYALYDGARSTP